MGGREVKDGKCREEKGELREGQRRALGMWKVGQVVVDGEEEVAQDLQSL